MSLKSHRSSNDRLDIVSCDVSWCQYVAREPQSRPPTVPSASRFGLFGPSFLRSPSPLCICLWNQLSLRQISGSILPWDCKLHGDERFITKSEFLHNYLRSSTVGGILVILGWVAVRCEMPNKKFNDPKFVLIISRTAIFITRYWAQGERPRA